MHRHVSHPVETPDGPITNSPRISHLAEDESKDKGSDEHAYKAGHAFAENDLHPDGLDFRFGLVGMLTITAGFTCMQTLSYLPLYKPARRLHNRRW